MSRNAAPVIVIGAGLSGLSSALALARAGREVMVLEAADQPGGCCSTAQVDGYTFNNGAVYVAVPSLLRRTFEQLGLDFDAEVPLVPIDHPHETHLDDDTVVHLGALETARVEGFQASSRTALLRDGLRKLQADWQPVYRRLLDDVLPFEPSLPRTLARLWRYLPKLAGRADSLIASYFRDPSLQAAVASILLYTGTAPARLPSSQLIGLLALLEEGFYLPKTGMGAITAAPLRALQVLGVPVRCGCKVERIEVGGDGVTGVALAGGEYLSARDVVATCSGFSVVNHLLPATAVPRSLQRTARKAPLSHRAVAVQLGGRFDEGSRSFIVNHVPAMSRQGEMHQVGAATPRWLSWTSPSQVLTSLAPAGRAVIELYAPVSGVEHAEQWTSAMTERALEGHLAALRKHLPAMGVETMRTIDPPTFAREWHLYEGALYGIAPGASPNAYFPHRTALPGLHLAGQTTFPGFGVPTAMLSGLQAAASLLAADH
ncbi:phytoene desaturase family protein [Paraburkholderia silviterrae]|uniref:NAD(P)/FAD-dependent oxidoreductase n=1 Tax=Paraburkholderia silviterrae TaxID=2528715 RepID=A0A4R5M7E4_9BURK|nr:NAD(P)/FAD-dependent oxidoreductase [Paraburkholderia silviterrae]TDG22133.1 NAD(P)/FAD-dependent oxidoreductase [Paraburkholderia silviterrae]